jgi:hypothetical protein
MDNMRYPVGEATYSESKSESGGEDEDRRHNSRPYYRGFGSGRL